MEAQSQSPQIGSMFLTFTSQSSPKGLGHQRRNPLKSGQCFLQVKTLEITNEESCQKSQSPQIGSMFLTLKKPYFGSGVVVWSQSPQIGSMFLTLPIFKFICLNSTRCVAIPSNRVNVSYICFFNNEINDNIIAIPVAIPSNRVNVSYVGG